MLLVIGIGIVGGIIAFLLLGAVGMLIWMVVDIMWEEGVFDAIRFKLKRQIDRFVNSRHQDNHNTDGK